MYEIRRMSQSDIANITDVHIKSFPGFFLTFMGKCFLSELYLGIVGDSAGIAFVYVKENRILGFVAGTSQPAGFYSRLLYRHWWRFALASLVPILKKPSIISRLFHAFQKPQDVSNQAGVGSLMSIAVIPDAQGLGIGKALVKVFLEESANRGLKHIDLTTDKNNNDSANQFYQNQGFQVSRTFVTPEGREMNEYMIDVQHL